MRSNDNNDRDDNAEPGRIVPFRPRTPRPRLQAFGNLSADDSPVQDVSKFDRDDGEADDYGHRMKMNALAVLVLAVLVGGGMWVVDTMAQLRKNQDCVLMGRRNCAGVTTPPNDRVSTPLTTPLSIR
jgi:hypothetical protein